MSIRGSRKHSEDFLSRLTFELAIRSEWIGSREVEVTLVSVWFVRDVDVTLTFSKSRSIGSAVANSLFLIIEEELFGLSQTEQERLPLRILGIVYRPIVSPFDRRIPSQHFVKFGLNYHKGVRDSITGFVKLIDLELVLWSSKQKLEPDNRGLEKLNQAVGIKGDLRFDSDWILIQISEVSEQWLEVRLLSFPIFVDETLGDLNFLLLLLVSNLLGNFVAKLTINLIQSLVFNVAHKLNTIFIKPVHLNPVL